MHDDEPPALTLLTVHDFAPGLGERWDVQVGDAVHRLVLTTIEPIPASNIPGARPDPFVLLFRSDTQDILQQQTCPFTHPAFGTTDIFFVPLARDEGGVTYQAVFN